MAIRDRTLGNSMKSWRACSTNGLRLLRRRSEGAKDVLQLAVLVANTEQGISQLAKRMEDLAGRGTRLSSERDELRSQRESAIERYEICVRNMERPIALSRNYGQHNAPCKRRRLKLRVPSSRWIR